MFAFTWHFLHKTTFSHFLSQTPTAQGIKTQFSFEDSTIRQWSVSLPGKALSSDPDSIAYGLLLEVISCFLWSSETVFSFFSDFFFAEMGKLELRFGI